MIMRIHYDRSLKSRSRELRNHSTLSEVLLWNQLKQRKMLGSQIAKQRLTQCSIELLAAPGSNVIHRSYTVSFHGFRYLAANSLSACLFFLNRSACPSQARWLLVR